MPEAAMPESIVILKGRHGGSSLCERCAVGSRIDDSQEGFYECHAHLSKPTIRRKGEGDGSIRLSPTILLNDESPVYPALNKSAVAGCELCAFIRKALLRRNIEWHGRVTISCYYIWAGKKWMGFHSRDKGLSYMRCDVYAVEERIAWIKFPIFAAGGKLASLKITAKTA